MKKLEAYKAFPIIAWFLVLGFSYYAYYLTSFLNAETQVLSETIATRNDSL
jgi:hypothetical protein